MNETENKHNSSVINKHENTIDSFIKSRRHLPHWQSPGCVYFVTFRTYLSHILDDTSKSIIYDNIIHYSNLKYKLYSFVVMPDHVHIILSPNEITQDKYYNLSDIMQAIKGFAAKKIIKHLKSQVLRSNKLTQHVFQSESFDRIIRNDTEFIEKMKYVSDNPAKKELVNNGEEYKWLYSYQYDC